MSENKCRWKSTSAIYATYECNEPFLPDDPDSYCILHSKKEDKDVNLFTEKVTDRIEKNPEKIDLIGCYFPKDFPSDYFKKFPFKKPVFFNEATFSQVVNFSYAKFSKGYFTRATFSQKADFLLSTFFQEAKFSQSIFSQEVDFSFTTFNKGVDFYGAAFKDRVFFLPVSKKGKGGVIIKVDFGGPTSFQHTRFLGDVIFQGVDLSRCSFLDSNIDRVDFRYCEFAKKGRRKNILRDELECDKKVAQKKVDRKEYEHVRRLYLELKRNFEEKKDWNTAGDFHYGEMECRRKMRGWLGRYFSLTAFYCWASGYCERPLRAFLILLGFVLIVFPLLYMISEGLCGEVWWDSLRVATFMRFGSPLEAGAGWDKRIVAVVEIIFVPIQTALLALALRRKVKR